MQRQLGWPSMATGSKIAFSLVTRSYNAIALVGFRRKPGQVVSRGLGSERGGGWPGRRRRWWWLGSHGLSCTVGICLS